jgi:PAS domain S-box-containing protein
MKDKEKTQKQPTKKLTQLCQRIAELEAAGHKRNQLEDALRLERDKAQQYLDIAEVILVALSKRGDITLINRKGNQILGYKEGELLGKNWFTTCVPSRLRKKTKSGFLRLMAGEIKLTEFYETPALTKSGMERIIAWHNTLLKDAQGNPVATLSSGKDITERKHMEEELRANEERYRLLFEEARDGIALADADTGILLECNQALADLVGRKREELIGQHQAILHPPSGNNTGISATFKKHLTNKEGQVLETQVLTVTGEIREVEIKANLLYLQGSKMLQGIFRDITERKQAEETLQKSEDKYRTILKNIEEGYYEVDLAGNFTFLNDAMCRIWGYPKEELMGMNNRQYTDKENAKKVFQAFNEVYRTGKIGKGYDYELIKKDGTRGYVEASISLRKDSSGKAMGFRGIIRDITERKKTEKELRESEERFRLAFENANIGVCLVDLEGNLTKVNSKMCEIFGYTKKELEHMTVNDIALPEDIDKSPEFIQKTLRGEIDRGIFEKRYIHKKGQVVTCEVSSSLVRDAEGTPLYFISHVHDITEQKKLQENLDNERKELKLIIDSSPIIVFYKDKEGRFIRVNKVFAEALKMTEKDFVGKTVFDLYPPQIAQGMTDDDQEVIRSRHPKLNIIEQYESASGIRWAHTDKIPIFDKDGVPIGLIGLAQDITERKQADELIKIRLRLLEFAATHSLAELLQKSLDEISEFTKSPVGFYHFIEQDQKTLSLQAWSTRTLEEFCKAAGAGMHYDIEEAGVWADCIRERRPVIHNDYASLPHRKGMPEGHAAIVRELVVPIIRNDRFVAILGIGNKPQDYTDQDVQVVSYLADVAWEIAERKRAGEALEESEKKYRQVVENATDIIYSTDINGNFTYANSVALKVTCYSLEELQRFNYLDLVVPEYRDQLKEIYGNQFSGRQATTYVEFPFSNKFGEVMWFGQNASLMIEGGKIIGFQVIARDISERKQAEEALRESEEKYRDLVENINDIIYATDESGKVTYISPTIEAISGYVPSEIIGRSFLEFVYQEDMSDVVQFFQQDISGQAAPREYRMVAKAGDVRWARTSSRPFFEGDRIVGLRGILTDITARKQAEEEIKRGYEQLQETLHSTVKALASTVEMKDQYTAGHQPRVTQLACAIAEEMGLSEDQIEGIRMAASIHDIGKIMVPAEILNKPGPLSEIQYEMIKMHPRAGYDILKGLKLPWPVAQIILQHHERQDGSGYPQGLSGEEIIVEARILAVANVVEAMNAHRPYRPAYDIKEALAEISKNRGTFYEATVVDACLRLFTEKGFTLAPVPR